MYGLKGRVSLALKRGVRGCGGPKRTNRKKEIGQLKVMNQSHRGKTTQRKSITRWGTVNNNSRGSGVRRNGRVLS